jgi:hypothetical protein
MTTSKPDYVVELVPAFMWDCPTCGRENFQRAITVLVPDSELPDHLNAEDGDGLMGTTAPERVTCRHPDCGATWQCQDFRAYHDEDQQ